ncbi:uncharacterized protein LOC111315192 [Durio zibethinus]|uniref:Uncharacterized protein LOC111315192 n=1 Tax=Durio zibethinus TaxID=66656 RepID=A0A6P6B6I5_DURZI|nr:uncharacterized protein LOC111315192 [Durio zibethinus]
MARVAFHDYDDDSFSSFPRSTYSISVSRSYSALDEIYRPDWGYIPKQPDSQTKPRGATRSKHDGALTLSDAPFQGTWAWSATKDVSPYYNSDTEGAQFSSWALLDSLTLTRGILIRWFMGFWNSHQVSHFATFFIDARVEISIAEMGELTLIIPLALWGGRSDRRTRPGLKRARGARAPSPPRCFDNASVGHPSSGVSTLILPQIALPTKNGHTPPPIESRKSFHSINPYYVWTCAEGMTWVIKSRSASSVVRTSRPVLTIRQTRRPYPSSNYEPFKYNNLNIRYWS